MRTILMMILTVTRREISSEGKLIQFIFCSISFFLLSTADDAQIDGDDDDVENADIIVDNWALDFVKDDDDCVSFDLVKSDVTAALEKCRSVIKTV
jgi:hypothetical protein